MRLGELLINFKGSIGCAGSNAPDEYTDWSYITYASNMADLKELWSTIYPKLSRDTDRAKWVDEKLQELFLAFEAGDKQRGRAAAWAIYNSDITELR